MTNGYKIEVCKVRKRRGVAFVGVWREGQPKAIGAFYSREEAEAAIAKDMGK